MKREDKSNSTDGIEISPARAEEIEIMAEITAEMTDAGIYELTGHYSELVDGYDEHLAEIVNTVFVAMMAARKRS